MTKGTRSESVARLRDLMTSRGWRQVDVCKMLELDPGSVSRILNGKQPLTTKQVETLARIGGVSLAEFYDGRAPGARRQHRGSTRSERLP